jgi:hypothetical protein
MSAAEHILHFEDLKRITGCTMPSAVERMLKSWGVHYFPSRGGPCTTIELLNAAGGLKASSNDEHLEEAF